MATRKPSTVQLSPLSPAQHVQGSGSIWAPGPVEGHLRCPPPPAAADSSSARGRESNEGCHEASFLLLFCFFEAKVNSSFPWFSPPARRPGPQPRRLSFGLSGVGPGVWTYQRSPGDSDCSWGQELLP